MKKGTVLTVGIVFCIMALVFIFSGTKVAAQEQIKLKYSSPVPENDPISIADKRILDKIEKLSNGRVRFERYFGGTLIPFPKSVVEIKAGVTDIGLCALTVAPTGFDVIKALLQSLPAVKDSTEMRRVHNEVVKNHPDLLKDFSNYGKPLAVSFPGPFQLGVKNPIKKFSDLKGLKIKATLTHITIMNQLGAEGLDMPSSETYLALSKGTINGTTLAENQLKTLKFAEVVKYVVPMNLFDPSGMWRMMNIDSWNKLPKDIQKIFTDIGEEWGKEGDMELAKANEEGRAFAKQQGVTYLDLPKAEMDILYKTTDSIIRDKMSKLDAKGIPATKIYDEYYKLILKY
jgi:TRAP-type transport system periplasmic protein